MAGGATTTYTYDANGNLVTASAGKYRTLSYTSFNLPDSQSGIQGPAGSPKYTWQYDESHARIKEVHTDANGTRTTWYLHPDNQGGLAFESETAASGTISNRHYLTAGGQTIGVLVSTGALPALASTQTAPTVLASVTLVKVEYWHKDHLGSLIATTDHAGAVTQRYAWDPFGKRRFTNGQYDQFGTLVIDWSASVNWGGDRGFTGHEQLDDIGLVHMNGRIFDATLGVFLQADPLVQDPGNLQNYNRYGYCFNNPLTCTDPSGLSFFNDWFGFGSISRSFKFGDPLTWRLSRTRIGYQVGSIAIAVVSSVYCQEAAAVCNGVGQAAWAAIAGYSAEQAIKTGVFAAISTSANTAIGEAFKGAYFSNTLAHGAWGCVEAGAQGGGCGSGFRSGLAGAALSNFGNIGNPGTNIGDRIINTIIHSAVGCAASVAGGGNCAQGAQSAAFAYLFNKLFHDRSPNNGRQFVLSNPAAMDELVKLNQAIIDLGYSDDQFTIRITGGDRFKDEDGNIRSSTDGRIVPQAALNSNHLESRGARGVDVQISGVSQADFLQALTTTDLSLLNVTYGDGHKHLDLPTQRWYAPRRTPPRNFDRQ